MTFTNFCYLSFLDSLNETKKKFSSETSSDAKSKLSLSEEKEFISVTSFEFINPNNYRQHSLPVKIPLKEIESKLIETSNYSKLEEIPHVSPETSSNDESSPLKDNADKENIPPVEDKENIPPAHTSAVVAMHPNDNRSTPQEGFVTPDQESLNITEETVLPEDLQRGVDLINCLVVSKKLDNTSKKKLIRRIIRRLLRTKGIEEFQEFLKSDLKRKESTSSSSSTTVSHRQEKEVSGVTKLSISDDSTRSNTPVVPADKEDSKIKDQTNGSMRDWLEPLTQSEIDREKLKKQQKQVENKLLEHQKNALEENERNIDIFSENMVTKFLEMEKRTHFNWIDREIEHLTNLKKLLISDKGNNQSDGLTPKTSKLNSDTLKLPSEDYLNRFKQRKGKDNIYENFKRVIENSSASDSKLSIRPATTASGGSKLFLFKTR